MLQKEYEKDEGVWSKEKITEMAYITGLSES